MGRLTDENIEGAARSLRIALNVDDQYRPDVFEALACAKALGIIKDYVTVDDSIIPGADAAYDPATQKIFLSATCRSRGKDHVRTRFSIAHEFGHDELDHTRRRNRSSVSMKASGRAASYIEIKEESEANRFAGAFLIPAHLVKSPLTTTAKELAQKFNVSEQVAEIRLEVLQRMFRRKHGIPRPLPGNVIDFLRHGGGSKALEIHEKTYGRNREVKFEGDPCPNPKCGEFAMVRRGTSFKCELCGTETGIN